MAPGAYVLHCSEATGDTSKAVEVVQDGATCLQVVRVSCGLGGWDDSSVIITEDSTTTMKKATVKSSQTHVISILKTNDLSILSYYITLLHQNAKGKVFLYDNYEH